MTEALPQHLEGDCGNPEQPSRVQAVVNVFGPTDMASCYGKSSVAWIFRLFMGGTPEEATERYKVASPIDYVSARTEFHLCSPFTAIRMLWCRSSRRRNWTRK